VTTTLIAPFTMTGLFRAPTVSATLAGSGIGSLSLVSIPVTANQSVWLARNAHLDISPTPEPASLMLLGLGAAAVWAFRRRREKVAQ
jgi:hypothetical protein